MEKNWGDTPSATLTISGEKRMRNISAGTHKIHKSQVQLKPE